MEKFVATSELYSENSIGSDPLPPGQVWVISAGGGDENPGLYQIDISEGPGGGVKILNQPAPPAFKESVRFAEQNLAPSAEPWGRSASTPRGVWRRREAPFVRGIRRRAVSGCRWRHSPIFPLPHPTHPRVGTIFRTPLDNMTMVGTLLGVGPLCSISLSHQFKQALLVVNSMDQMSLAGHSVREAVLGGSLSGINLVTDLLV